jgi:hypothetical protein
MIGLGCDGDTTGGWLVLDLPTLDALWPTRANGQSIWPRGEATAT